MPPTFIVHELRHAVAALNAARKADIPVIVRSAPGAVRTGGAGWWRALIAQARAAVPDARAESILDCAGEPGMALAAIREGVEGIAVSAPGTTGERLADIARQSGVAIAKADPATACDLAGSNDPQADCEIHIRTHAAGVAKPAALG